ncbi:MAG TPA: T9SS type A sorting domain-containing protein, partial [Bacteroidales bacterium]|nr:T9SS type A sorting domain-containing protein [Bacteroidales bacterium]
GAPDIGAYELQKKNNEDQEDTTEVNTIGPNTLSPFMEVKIYPNPANDKVTLEFRQQPEPGTRIILTDLTGKQLMIQHIKSVVDVLNVQSFPAGIYLIIIESGSNYMVNKLLIN